MTDRELLEMASKAAGIDKDYPLVFGDRGAHYWNPLIDDGDALRLAVKLGLKDYFGIEIQSTCTQCTAFEPWEHIQYEDHNNDPYEYHNNDPYAATRRAIVRAAAEIGRGME